MISSDIISSGGIDNILKDLYIDESQLEYQRKRYINALNRLSTDYEMTYEYALTKKEDVEIESAKEEVIQLRQAISRLGNVNLDAPNEKLDNYCMRGWCRI